MSHVPSTGVLTSGKALNPKVEAGLLVSLIVCPAGVAEPSRYEKVSEAGLAVKLDVGAVACAHANAAVPASNANALMD